jgi:hypothetical protein
MRSSLGFALVLVTALTACNGGETMGDDTVVEPDAPGTIEPPARGFQVTSADITIMPGQEITYCYYFRTPNTETMAINKWKSVMTEGSHHMIMFTTATDVMPPGTFSASSCGFGGGSSGANVPSWTYSAQNVLNEIELPSDDGTGKPLAQEIAANTPAYFQMHYLNPSDQPMVVHVTLNAEALPAATAFTKTAAYTTYNGAISIPPMSTNVTATKTCKTPTGSSFWAMSTHAHKQAVKTTVKNGAAASTTIAFESTDWEHPGGTTWMAAPFYTFTGDDLTFACTYNNPTNRTITSGDSAATDEMCMAAGYYFPATKPVFCYCTAQSCFNF